MPELLSGEPRARVLIIDDDSKSAHSLADLLAQSGYQASVAESGAAAKAQLGELRPDLVILDIMVRDVDGLMLCADIKNSSGVPVIVCSGTCRRHDRVLALRLGADDFIGKPFDFDEVEARVAAVLRRAGWPKSEDGEETARLHVGPLIVDTAHHFAAIGKHELQTTPMEYRLLCILASRPGGVFTREVLAEAIWGFEVAAIGRAIDTHVSRLKRKLLTYAAGAPRIVAVRGEGYKLVWNGGNSEAES